MRTILLIAAALSLSGCASGVSAGNNGGLATYDDLKTASQACAAKSGKLVLKHNGDANYLPDYGCEKAK